MKHLVIITFASTMVFGMLGCSDTTNSPSATNVAAPTDTGAATVETSSGTLSPEETLARLTELARAGDWEIYVDDFYGESHKFEGLAERRAAVVARFRDKWAAKVIAELETLAGKTAEIAEDGKTATFSVDGKPVFLLYLSDDGRWTFHL